MTEIEVAGFEIFGRHGVEDDERVRGQIFVLDVWLTVPHPQSDDISATADYREVRRLAQEVSDANQFQLLETFAAAVAEAIVQQLRPERVRVRVRKHRVQWALHTAATVERP